MADPYADFSSPVEEDPYASFSSQVGSNKFDRNKSPEEYDPKSFEYQKKYGNLERPSMLNAVAEPLMHVLSQGVAVPAAGLAALGTSLGNTFGADLGEYSDPVDNSDAISRAMTYQPRTPEGQQGADVLTYLPKKLAQFGDYVGGGIAEAADSPLLGAAANTAIQTLPALFLKGGKGKAQPQPRVSPSFGPQVSAGAQYASSIGLDWGSLSREVQQRLTDIAGKSKDLSGIDSAAVARQAQLESMPVPIRATRGQLTRDPVQLRNEGNVAATEAGRPIRDIHVAANKAILENLELLKKKQGGKAESAEQVGASVQGAARANLDSAKSEVRRLYKDAEAKGELQGHAPTRTLAKLIEETPDKMHLSWVETWLNKSDLVTDQVGRETKGLRYKASLKELEDLRQAAVARAMNGGTDGYYAGKVIGAIDEATEGVGGSAYKEARAARKAQAMEFDEQAGVSRLVDDKSRTDRAVALEDTWRKTVIGGSIEDLRSVRKNLLAGKNSAAGQQAWRDLRAETIQHVINEAGKSVARFEDGTPNITPASMERAIRSVGKDKLEVLFGRDTVLSIDKIMEATRTIKTEPPQIHKGSSTASNVIALLERGLDKIPFLGKYGAGTIAATRKIGEIGQAGREVRQAQNTPLRAAAYEAEKKIVQNRRRDAVGKFLPYEAPAQGRD